MAIDSDQVAVTDIAAQVVPAAAGGMPGSRRVVGPTRYVLVKNTGAKTIYIGGITVASDSGVSIAAGGSFPLWLYDDEAIYAVTAPGDTSVASYIQSGAAPTP